LGVADEGRFWSGGWWLVVGGWWLVVGWLVGWLVGWSVGRLVVGFFGIWGVFGRLVGGVGWELIENAGGWGGKFRFFADDCRILE
jgi:hypothetical protein